MLLFLSPVALFAELPQPAGEEFQVNTFTPGWQSSASVAADLAGNFLVVWDSPSSSMADSEGAILGQRYAADGSPIGNEFQIATGSIDPDIAMHPDGSFVVVWEQVNYGIRARRFASDGASVGIELEVTQGSMVEPAVAMDRDGSFVVVWEGFEIEGQRFSADGSFLGGRFQANTRDLAQERPDVAMDHHGNFIVVWDGVGYSDVNGIHGQIFDSNGDRVGGEFGVNTYTNDCQLFPSVSMDEEGSFVVVWSSYGADSGDTSFRSLQGQRFFPDGQPNGIQFQVNTTTALNQENPVVSMTSNRGFVVAWTSGFSNGSDKSDSSIQGQLFDSSGARLGSELQVNTYTTGAQDFPAIAYSDAGIFIVVWESGLVATGPDGDQGSIQGRRFHVRLFADGFESGDTSAWSVAIP